MKTVSFYALGCRVNQYEIQALRETFENAGYTEVPFGKETDVCVINTCAVTKESERKSRNTYSKARKFAKKIVLTGCYAELLHMTNNIPSDVFHVGGCSKRDKILSACEGAEFEYSSKTSYEHLSIGNNGKLPNERYRAYVKIQDGCNGRCAYCIIPKLRGKSFSRNEADILDEIKRLASNGVSEIIFTGIEVSDYGTNALCSLIKKASETEGIKRIRLGSLNPNTLTPNFIQTISECPKFCHHIHLSIQSGSSATLKSMHRPYDAEKLYSVISSLREKVPDMMLSADIISGFPGEDEKDFEETLEFIRKIRFMHVHAFAYSIRPFTEAAGFEDQIPEEIKKSRNNRIIEISEGIKKSLANEKKCSLCEVLVEKNSSGHAFGHTNDFFEARIENCKAKVGSYVKCIVTGYDGVLICSEDA